jgi:hypothetical protein
MQEEQGLLFTFRTSSQIIPYWQLTVEYFAFKKNKNGDFVLQKFLFC